LRVFRWGKTREGGRVEEKKLGERENWRKKFEDFNFLKSLRILI